MLRVVSMSSGLQRCRFPPFFSCLLWRGNPSWLNTKSTDCFPPGLRQRATTPILPSFWIMVTFRDSCEKCWSIVRLKLERSSEPCGVVGSIARSLKRWSKNLSMITILPDLILSGFVWAVPERWTPGESYHSCKLYVRPAKKFWICCVPTWRER